jgi:hypothetical protein
MTIGGLAYNRTSNELAISMMDPTNISYTNGIRYLNSDTSSATFGQYLTGAVLTGNDVSGVAAANTSFMKSTSMGDVELMCDSAPVQIGNRVWIDTNENGIQDPGEPPVAGVYVLLYAATGATGFGNQVGTAITNANGEYYFSSNNSEGWWAGVDEFGGGLTVGQSYRIRMDWPSTYTGSGALAGYELTQATATSASTALDTSVDNNATTVSSYPQIDVPTVTSGMSNHTYDFGFKLTPAPTTTTSSTTSTSTTVTSTSTTSSTTSTSTTVTSTSTTSSTTSTSTTIATTTTTSSIPPATIVPGGVSVGNYVWIDLNKDGVQDAGEPGITGVNMVLRDLAGREVTDLNGKTVGPTSTDLNGYYYFSNLPIGRYEVFISYPVGYSPTRTGSGTSATDSSTDSAVSKNLPTAGMKDDTLDFGVIISAVIEEPVWIDANGDGFFSTGEKPVPGADVIVLNEDGTPARNLRGESVTPVQTQADGTFRFKDLPPGKYKVIVVYPSRYTSPVTGSTTEAFTTEAVVPPSAVAQSKGTASATQKQVTARKVERVVSIGNLVWFDRNKNGFQDANERGVAGATLAVFKADGVTPARDAKDRAIRPQRTSSNGRYLFTNLPPGGFVVKITYPAGYRATVAKSAGRAKNSSTDVSKSLKLVAGESDMTLDFGLVRMPITRLPATL